MKNGKARMSRRKFLAKGGIAAMAAMAAMASESKAARAPKKKTPAPPPPPEKPPEEPPVTLTAVELNLTVNGKKISRTVPAGRTLAEFLKEDLGYAGVKIGCGHAECGACTVLVNLQPVYSCRYLAVLADQGVVETIEGVAPAGADLHPIQKAFMEHDALQCGFCTPGMICAAKSLIAKNPKAEDEDIREGLAGNLCRCGAYQNILAAVRSVSRAS